MNISEFARHCNVSRVSIYNALKTGTLEKNNDGEIDENSSLALMYRESQSSDHARKKYQPSKYSDGRSGGSDANSIGIDTKRLKDELLKQQVIALQMKNLKDAGALLKYETMIDKFIYPVQDALKKISGDISQTIPIKCYEIIKNNGTVQDAQSEALKIINRAIGANVKKIKANLDEIKSNKH